MSNFAPMFVREKNNLKKVIAMVVAINYLFIVLFSGELHNHPTDFFQGMCAKKTEARILKSQTNIHNNSTCLSCYFTATNFSLVPEVITFHLENYTKEVSQILSVQERIWSQIKFCFQLRGPPAFI